MNMFQVSLSNSEAEAPVTFPGRSPEPPRLPSKALENVSRYSFKKIFQNEMKNFICSQISSTSVTFLAVGSES